MIDLTKILTISGKPGLYRIISKGKSTSIVEDVLTKKRTSLSSRNQVSILDNISVYTNSDDLPLKEVLIKIYEKK